MEMWVEREGAVRGPGMSKHAQRPGPKDRAALTAVVAAVEHWKEKEKKKNGRVVGSESRVVHAAHRMAGGKASITQSMGAA